MAEITKKYKRKALACRIISALLTLAPIIVYVIMAFINGGKYEKFTLGVTVTVSLLFVIINIAFKHRIRSTIWIVLIGIYICLDNITSLLLLIASSTILDEFIFEPLSNKYKQRYIINKEIDKRGV